MIHELKFRPIFGDVDAMNVVYYGNYLRFFESGRTELMRSVEKPYAIFVERGLHLPVTECHIKYRRPAMYDDPLVLKTSLSWLKRASLRFDYTLVKQLENGGETELVTGYTVHGCINLEGRVTAFPPEIMQELKKVVVMAEA